MKQHGLFLVICAGLICVGERSAHSATIAPHDLYSAPFFLQAEQESLTANARQTSDYIVSADNLNLMAQDLYLNPGQPFDGVEIAGDIVANSQIGLAAAEQLFIESPIGADFNTNPSDFGDVAAENIIRTAVPVPAVGLALGALFLMVTGLMRRHNMRKVYGLPKDH